MAIFTTSSSLLMGSRASRALTLVVLSSIEITRYLTLGHPEPRIESISLFSVQSQMKMFYKYVQAMRRVEVSENLFPSFCFIYWRRWLKSILSYLGKSGTFAKVRKMQRDLLKAIFFLICSANFHFIFSNLSTHGPPKGVSKNSTTTREELGPSKVSCSS